MMDKRVYIFGVNALADLLYFYLNEQGINVQGYTLNEKYIERSHESSVPVFAIEKEIERFGADGITVYVAIAYANLNKSRQQVYNWLRSTGVEIRSYIHPSAVVAKNATIGTGCILLENVSVQPFCVIGDGNIVWNNTTISHHSVLGSFNYLAPSVTLSGRVTMGDRCFIGSGSTFRNDVNLGSDVIVGAGAYVNCSLADRKVCLPQRSVVLEGKDSSDIHIT